MMTVTVVIPARNEAPTIGEVIRGCRPYADEILVVDGQSTDETPLNRFIAVLVGEGVRVTVRRSRGQDIDAACGQLAAKEL